MTLTVITPTCDRPVGITLLGDYMARQTLKPTQWIVVDGGQQPVGMGLLRQDIAEIKYSWKPAPAGAGNLCANLLRALPYVRGELIAFMEDDDWYAPTHLEMLRNQLTTSGTQAAGDPLQRYYNIAETAWRVYHNKGASLCQTGVRSSLLPLFEAVVRECAQKALYGIDGYFWQRVPREGWNLLQTGTSVGVKGLPGQPGLGVGHRPDYRRGGWRKDPGLDKLREWIGAEDIQRYIGISETKGNLGSG